MARRVGMGTAFGENEDVLKGLAFLQELVGKDRFPIEDVAGTGEAPPESLPEAGATEFGDVRQNEYLPNLRNLSYLPSALSDDQDVRRDADEGMNQQNQAFGEEQMEGLGGEMGGALASNDEVGFNESMIPRNQKGEMMDPLEAIRMSVEENPDLMAGLPEETRQRLSATPTDRERAFVSTPEAPESAESVEAEMAGLPVEGEEPPVEAVSTAPEIVPPSEPITEEMVASAPTKEPKKGAVKQLSEDDQLIHDLTLLSKNTIPPEQLDRAKEWEDVLTKRRASLNEQEKALLQKAETKELSTFDKVAIGIALAAPILIGLRYGAAAGFISAGEGLTAGAKVYSALSPKSADNLKKMDAIQKAKIQLAEKDVEINKKMMDSITDKDVRNFLKGKKARKIGNQVGISTGDESGILWLDGRKFEMSDDGVKRAREVIKDADETIGVMKDSNKVVDEILGILDEIPQNTGMWDAIKKNAQWFTTVGGKNPFGGEGPRVDIRGPDGKVRRVDAMALLKQKINLMQDVYNKRVLGGNRLTNNVVNHWEGILGDPSRVQDWLTQDLDTFKETTRSLKDIMNSREVESLVGEGFLRQPLETAFPSSRGELMESTDRGLDEIRRNPKAFKSKVK
jgi:hypothetical protein